MPPLKHSILKKQLDIELPDKASSHQWMERLSRLGNGALVRALDETLTQLDLHPNHIERYDHIELDLGNISAASFEKEFVEKLIEALKAHLYLQRAKRQLDHYSNDGVGQHFPIGQSRMDLLSHFLKKGWLPWWYQASSYGNITNILQESLEKQPKMLVALLQKLQKQQQEDIIGRRLSWQFPSEQLQKLVQLLAPKADLSVLAYLQQIQKWKSKLKLKISTQQFKQDLFRFTLDYLARKNGVVVMEQFKTYLQTTLTETYQLSKKQQKKWWKARELTPIAKTWTALEILTFFLDNAYLPSNTNVQNSQELTNLYETVLETEPQAFLQWLLGKKMGKGKQKRSKKARRLILQRFVNQLDWLALLPHLVEQQLGTQLTAYYNYMLKEWSWQEWMPSVLQWKNSIGIFTILYFGTNKKHTIRHFSRYQNALKVHLIQTFTLPEITIEQLSKIETTFQNTNLKQEEKTGQQATKAFQEEQETAQKKRASKVFSETANIENKVAEIGADLAKKETAALLFQQILTPDEGKKSTSEQDTLKAINEDVVIPLTTSKRITPKANWFQDIPQLGVFTSLEHYLEMGFFPENTAKIFQQLTFDIIFYELLTDSPEALLSLLQKKTTKATKIERWAAPLRTTTLKTLVKYLQPNWFGFIETLSLALQTYLKNKNYSLSIDKTRTQTKGKAIWQLLVEVLLVQKNSTNLSELLLHVLQRLSSEIRQTERAISAALLTWLATKGVQSRFTPLTYLLQQIEGQLSHQLKQTSSTEANISNTQSDSLNRPIDSPNIESEQSNIQSNSPNTPSDSPNTFSKPLDTQVGSSLTENGADSSKNQKTKKQSSNPLTLNAKNDEFRVKEELSLLRFFLLYGYYPEKIAAGLGQQTPNDLFTKSLADQANKLITLLTTIPEQQIVIQRLIAQIDTPQLYQLFEKIHPKQTLFLKGMHDVLRLFMLKQNIEQAVLKTLLWQIVLETLLRSKKSKQVNIYWLEQTLKALSKQLQINEVKVINDFLTYLMQSKATLFINETEPKSKRTEIKAEILFLLKQLLNQKIKIANNEQEEIKENQVENAELTTFSETPINQTEGKKSADSPQTPINIVEEMEGAKSVRSPETPVNVTEETEGKKSVRSPQTRANIVEETEGAKSANSSETPVNVIEETEGKKSVRSPETRANVIEETEGAKSVRSPETPVNVVDEIEDEKSADSPQTRANIVEETEGEKSVRSPEISANVIEEIEIEKIVDSPEMSIPSNDQVEREESIRSSEATSGLTNDVEGARNETKHQDIVKDLTHLEVGEFAKKDFRKVAQQLQADLFGFVVTIELAITQYLSKKKDISTTIQEIQWQVLIPILQQINTPLTVKDLIAQTLLGLREYLKTPIADLVLAFKQIAKTAVTQGKQRFFVLDIMLQQLDSNALSKQGIEKDKLKKTILPKDPSELGVESLDNQLSEGQKLETETKKLDTEKKFKEALQEENTLGKYSLNSTKKIEEASPETRQKTEKEGGTKQSIESNKAQIIAKEKANKTKQDTNQKGKLESIETEDTLRADSTEEAVKTQQGVEKQSDEQSEKGTTKQNRNQQERTPPIGSLKDENKVISLLESLVFFLKNAYFPKSPVETSEGQTFGDLFDKVYQESPNQLLTELQKIATKEVVNRLVNSLNEAQIQQLLNLLAPTEIVSIQSMRLLLIAIESTESEIDTIGKTEQWQCLLAVLFQSQKQLTTFELLQSWFQGISKKQNIAIVDLALVYLKKLPELISKHGQRFTPINIVLQQIVSKQTETSSHKSLEKEQEAERNEFSTFEGTKTATWKGIEELAWIEFFLLNGVLPNFPTTNQRIFTFEQAFTLALRKDASLLRTLLKKHASNRASVKRLIANLSQASLVDLSMLLAGHRGGNMVQGLVWALQQVDHINLQIAWQTVLPYLLQDQGFEPKRFLVFSLDQLNQNTSANKGMVISILQAFLETTTRKERIYFDQLKISLQKIIESSSTDKQELDLSKKQRSHTNSLNVILEEEVPDKDSAAIITDLPTSEENALKISLKTAKDDTAPNTDLSSTENTTDDVKDSKKVLSKKDKTVLDAVNIPPEEEGNLKKQLQQETTPKITVIALLQWFLEKGYLPDWANEILGKKNVVDLVAELLEQQSNGLRKLLLLLLPKENSRNRIVVQFPETLLWKTVQLITSKEQTLLPVYFDLLSAYLLNYETIERQEQQQAYQVQWATFFEYLIEKNIFREGAGHQLLVDKSDSYLVVGLLQQLGEQLERNYAAIIKELQAIAEERSQDGEEKLYPILDILQTEQRHLSLEKNFAQLKENQEIPNQTEETSQDIDVIAFPTFPDKEAKKTDTPVRPNDTKKTITNKNASQSEIEADVEEANLENSAAIDTLEENRKESEKKDSLNREDEDKIEQKAVELIEELKGDKTEGKTRKRDDLVESEQQELMNEQKEKILDITSKKQDFSPQTLDTPLKKATRSIESEESLEQNISDETVSEKTAQAASSLEELNPIFEKTTRPIESEASLEQNISDETVSEKTAQADFSFDKLNPVFEKTTRPIESEESLEQNISDETVSEKTAQAGTSFDKLNPVFEKTTRPIESEASLEQNISDEIVSEKTAEAGTSLEPLNPALEKPTRPIESEESLEQTISDETVSEKVAQADFSFDKLNPALEKTTRPIESEASLEQNISDETVSEKVAQAGTSLEPLNPVFEKTTRPIESEESLEQTISDETVSEKNEQQPIHAKLDAFKESDSVIDAKATKEANQITETREEITDTPLVPSLSEEGTTPVFDIFELTRYLRSNILPYDFEVFEMRFQYLVVRQPFAVKPGIIELIQKEEQALKIFIHQFSPTSFLSLLQLLQKEAATKINGYLESLNVALKPALNKRILLQYLATLGDSPFDLEEWLMLVISAMSKNRIERQKLISSTLHFLKYGQVSTKRTRRELIDTLRNILTNWYPDKQQQKATSSKKDKQSNNFVPKRKLIEDTLLINNAGLVLLHPFLTHYFSLLGYIKTIPDPSAKGKIKMRKVFKDESLAHRGVHLLSFLVNTRTDCPEHELLLNKVMCGVDIATPIPGSIEMTSKELEESERLLKVMIARWERLKNISVRYLRGSFLMRNGTLKDSSKKWTVTVEKQAFDLLLKTLPWGLAFIRFPWMEKPITTKWY